MENYYELPILSVSLLKVQEDSSVECVILAVLISSLLPLYLNTSKNFGFLKKN